MLMSCYIRIEANLHVSDYTYSTFFANCKCDRFFHPLKWAFGVTCWEVFTCGGVPYAGIPAMSLLSQLRNGHRLDRPSNVTCSDDM